MANPLCGCILIGGKSLRMGQPKQLIVQNGKTWFEIIYQQLASVCQKVIIVGDGALPPGEWHRVSDDETCNGPLAGLLAAMKTNDQANFIVCSCDIPNINDEAVEWLLRQIEPDVWAVLPSIKHNFVEPLFAYDDKVFHFGVYAILAILAARNLAVEKPLWSPAKIKTIAILFVCLYGVSDEIHQAFVPERYASVWDIFADCAGSIAGCVFYMNFIYKKPLYLNKQLNKKN